MGIPNVHKHQHNHKTKPIYPEQYDMNLEYYSHILDLPKIKQVVARYCGAQQEATPESEGRGHYTRAHGLLGSQEGEEAEGEDGRKPDGGVEGEDSYGDRVVQADRGKLQLQLQSPNGQSPLEAAVPGSGNEQTVGSSGRRNLWIGSGHREGRRGRRRGCVRCHRR